MKKRVSSANLFSSRSRLLRRFSLGKIIKSDSLTWYVSFLILILFFAAYVYKDYQQPFFKYSTATGESQSFLPSPTPTPTTTTSPFQVMGVQAEKPTIDPNPVIKCQISQDCGGGTRAMRQSECLNTACCQLSNGKWYFYLDREQCKKDQEDGRKQLDDAQIDFNNWMSDLKNYEAPTITPEPAQPIYLVIPTPDQESIAKCKKIIDDKYATYYAGCAFLSGSAAFQCEQKYRSEAAYEKMVNCK